ncbi:MAG TPA: YaiI/YqxD family protein [Spirochaetota bacterium]|nr:YaiI/YqxD family protein [Spirochaetota bacterium]
MNIYVDADAIPVVIREILYRAAERVNVPVILVANVSLKFPQSQLISMIVVPAGPDEADDKIAEMAAPGDLVITADIPLASRVIEKGAMVIDSRGAVFSRENIGERLTMRNFMEDLRNSGIDTGGPSAFTPKERQAFANQLDRILTKYAASR